VPLPDTVPLTDAVKLKVLEGEHDGVLDALGDEEGVTGELGVPDGLAPKDKEDEGVEL
jgi:hypothetical protein